MAVAKGFITKGTKDAPRTPRTRGRFGRGGSHRAHRRRCGAHRASRAGPGLLESVYEACLAEELRQRGLTVERQVGVPVTYGDVSIDVGFRLDLLIERQVVVEVKSIDALASIHVAQLITYLRFSRVRLGYLINFNSVLIKNGIRRLVV